MNIDIEMIAVALEDHSYMINYWFDAETGEVMPLKNELWGDDDEDEEALKQQIEDNPARFRLIQSMPSHESFSIMEDFVEQMKGGEEKRRLLQALLKRKPFRTFKDALFDMPEIREKWFAFKNEQMTAHVLNWLEDQGIAVTQTPEDTSDEQI